ncbi:hypothetical protein KIF53_22570, partial [Chromobacterium subtsugae]
CQSGRWNNNGGEFNGSYQFLGTYTGKYSGYNSSKKATFIQISGGYSSSGGSCGNEVDLSAQLPGIGTVASAGTSNPEWSKIAFISFLVPAYTNYNVTSYPWACGPGIFNVFSFNLF